MFDDFLAILFPERCRGCNIPGTALCAECQKALRPALPINEPANAFALFDYQQAIVQKAVWELKYHRRSPLAKKLLQYGSPIVMEHIADMLQTAGPVPLVLVPIPQYYTKTYSRGFNQSELLSKWLKAALLMATLQPLLRKTRATDAQARTHTRQQRQKNLAHSMETSGSIDAGALYIIVDDVITTGSTVTEASRALRAAGAKNICAIALAHGYARK